MKIKTLVVLLAAFLSFNAVFSQSKTTEALHKKFNDARAFFFYNNTLRMLNQKEDPELDAIIKDIEKMKFLMIHKSNTQFDYRKLVSDYKSESFEEMMTSRADGKNFDVFVKEKDGKTKGMLVLINDATDLYVLDIVGSIALNHVTKLYSKLDGSVDIGKQIRDFSRGDEEKKSDGDKNPEEKSKQ
jgi:hypothetical protein